MPVREQDIWDKFEGKISFEKPGGVTVLLGPCSGRPWVEEKIPLDGRHYKCAGTVILKNGQKLFASFSIQTHTFDFLERDAVWCKVGDTWYRTHEPEFLGALGVTSEEAFPYTWLPDRPLDFNKPGPYPMNFFEDAAKRHQQT